MEYLSHLAPPENGHEIGDDEEEGRSKVDSATGSEIDEIEQVRREVQCFTMASHLFWSLWAIVNVYQEIEFGYMEYAICRLKQYQQAKKCYLETMHTGGEQTPPTPADPEK